jgi:hypothetical protein
MQIIDNRQGRVLGREINVRTEAEATVSVGRGIFSSYLVYRNNTQLSSTPNPFERIFRQGYRSLRRRTAVQLKLDCYPVEVGLLSSHSRTAVFPKHVNM